MRALLFILSLVTVVLAATENSFCDVCSKGWEEKVPKSWAEVTGYLNLGCFQLAASLKPTCMGLVNSLPLNNLFDTFRPKLISFGEAVCGFYCK